MTEKPQQNPHKISRIKGLRIYLKLLLLLLVMFICWRQWRIWSVPDVGVPFDEAEFWADYDLDYRNETALKYMQASEEFSPLQRELKPFNLRDEDEPSLSEKMRNWELVDDLIKDWLAENREVIHAWRELIEQDVPVFINDRWEDFTQKPSPFRQDVSVEGGLPVKISQLMLLEAARLRAEGKVEQAFRWHQAVLKLGLIVRQIRPGSITIGTSIMDEGIGASMYLLSEDSITVDQLRELRQSSMESNDDNQSDKPLLVGLYYEMQTDYAEMNEEAVYYFPNLILGESELFRRNQNLLFQNWLANLNMPDSEETEWMSFKAGETQVDIIVPTTAQQKKYEIQSAETIEKSIRKIIDPVSVYKRKETAFSWYYPSLSLYVRVLRREHMKRSLLQLSLALHIYHREYGAFPETLEQLLPQYLNEVPTDNYSYESVPLKYRREGKNAVIWSNGEDYTDNNGLGHAGENGWHGTDISYVVFAPGTSLSDIQSKYDQMKAEMKTELNKPIQRPRPESTRDR